MTSPRLLAPTAAFGFDMLRRQVAADKGKNVFISPLSISVALAMTANGASGETFAGMSKALGLPDYGDKGNTNNLSYSNLISALTGDDLGVTMKIANSIWAAKTNAVKFSKSFLDANQDHFKAEVNEEDFGDPATATKMNQWCSDNTEEKITSIVEEIPADMVMYLLNAVYFNGKFGEQFDKDRTYPQPFNAPDGVYHTPIMSRNADFNYTDIDEDFEMVALPFGDSDKRFSLFVLLPRKGKTADDVVAGLTAGKFFTACKDLRKTELDLYLPKFEVEYDVTLNQALIDQGMGDAFDGGKADFSRMFDSAAGNLYISEVKHKVYARVDEEGAEAAAVTSLGIALECAFVTQRFIVDRPFVTLIADQDTGTVAFAGLINKPEAPKA